MARPDFQLHVCVDFFDDLIAAPFTREMFGALFGEFKSWGVARCDWMYYGGRKGGLWDFAPLGVAEHAAATFENVGDVFATAVDAAHAHGIDLYGLVKPFDMGCLYHRPGGREGQRLARVQRIGGGVGWVCRFVAEHPELLMARRPEAWGDARNSTFTQIDLVKEDDAPCAFGVADIDIHFSDNNVAYEPYTGPVRTRETVEEYPAYAQTPSGMRPTGGTRRTRVMRLDGLSIDAPFVALSVAGREASFTHRLGDLVHVFGEQGEEQRFTLGCAVRKGDGDFRKRGIEYGFDPGTPTAIRTQYSTIVVPFTLDAGDGFIAVARGKQRSPLAALSPSYPEVHAFWLSWVNEVLDAGADGVELRVSNHHSELSWAEFGFEPPVAEAFRRRTGVDLLTTDDFDRGQWRRVRGEAYTQFVREAHAAALARGKRLGLHVSALMDTEPETEAAMDIHWDWRTWLDEGLGHSVSLKDVRPRSSFAQDILDHARPRNIPVVYCPFNSIWLGEQNLGLVAERIEDARASGCSGYQFYESAALIAAGEDGSVRMTQPALRDYFRSIWRPEKGST